ncbi:MAG: DUF1343 domain-containing protein [Bacteroidia bacterium]|nr:DUF1343 domain-containing protein [Bacteroidia bacterium]
MCYPAKYIKIFSLTLIISCLAFIVACNGNENEEKRVSINDSTNLTAEIRLPNAPKFTRVKVGAENLIENELENLKGKKVAVVGNQTSRFFNGTHLVDSLLSRGVEVIKVFAPEHGFRGTADAGEHVKDGVDTKTGLPIISLYGKNRKPGPQQLKGIDLVIFDIQDVGVRLYTYISTMSYVMETCEKEGISFWVLDRPNPNGWYVDGPVLEKKHASFIGLHEIPVVHGMSIGEYAQMVKGEENFGGFPNLDLKIIQCSGYSHDMKWEATGWPWRAPSPNLASIRSTYLYPALVMFEPTPMSVGRGTDSAFTILGSPWFKPEDDFRNPEARMAKSLQLRASVTSFIPKSLPGKSKYPKFQDQKCEGLRLESYDSGKDLFLAGIVLFQRSFSNFQMMHASEPFFKKNFNRWPGYDGFKQDVIAGKSPNEIYDSWQGKLSEFKELRAKYLLYP